MGSLTKQARRERQDNTNHPRRSASKHRDHIDHTIAHNLLMHRYLATRFHFWGDDDSLMLSPWNFSAELVNVIGKRVGHLTRNASMN